MGSKVAEGPFRVENRRCLYTKQAWGVLPLFSRPPKLLPIPRTLTRCQHAYYPEA